MTEDYQVTSTPVEPSGDGFQFDNADDDIVVFDDTLPKVESDYNGMLQGPNFQSFIDPLAYPTTDEAALNTWLATLDEAQKKELNALKAGFDETLRKIQEAHDKLTESIPELYQATLPPLLEERLEGAPYALGFHQGKPSSVEEATAMLELSEGIHLAHSPIDQRFLVYSKAELGGIDEAIDSGYYGDPDIGRFVVAFPSTEIPRKQEVSFAGWISNQYRNAMPSDAVLTDGEDAIISTKCIAGFIDSEGTFWANRNFWLNGISDFAVYSESVEK